MRGEGRVLREGFGLLHVQVRQQYVRAAAGGLIAAAKPPRRRRSEFLVAGALPSD